MIDDHIVFFEVVKISACSRANVPFVGSTILMFLTKNIITRRYDLIHYTYVTFC